VEEKDIKDEIVKQIVDGDRYQLELARDKVDLLRNIGAIQQPVEPQA
jgi:hypothetical protein